MHFIWYLDCLIGAMVSVVTEIFNHFTSVVYQELKFILTFEFTDWDYTLKEFTLDDHPPKCTDFLSLIVQPFFSDSGTPLVLFISWH